MNVNMPAGPRIPRLRPDQLDEAQRAVYDGIVGGPRAAGPQRFRLTEDDGSLTGPFGALLVAPAVGTAMSRLGEAIRYQTSLDDRVREIAILVVAARHRSDFEWYAHAAIGRHVGLDDELLAALFDRRRARCRNQREQAAHDLAYRAAAGDVDDDTWQAAVDDLGPVAAVEVVLLVGYYTALATILGALRIGTPDGEPAPFTER